MSVVGGWRGENDGTVLVEALNGVINKLRVLIDWANFLLTSDLFMISPFGDR